MKYSIKKVEKPHDDFITVEKRTLQHEKFDGSLSDVIEREVVVKDHAVASLVFHKEKEEFIFVNQFRAPATDSSDAWVTEFVAGHIDNNESAEAAIRREILEEIGYEVHDMNKIATFFTSPGYSNERIILFYCEVSDKDKVSEGGGDENEAEDIQIIQLSEAETLDKLRNNNFKDAKTIIGLQHYFLHDKLNSIA